MTHKITNYNYFASPVIIEVKICYRQTDRLTNSLTPYTGVCGFFLQVEFVTSKVSDMNTLVDSL